MSDSYDTHLKKSITRTLSAPESSNFSLPRDISIKRTHSTINNKSSTDLFWNIVGRDNYTISLNQSPVLCNSSSPPVEDLFYTSTSFARKFRTFPWRAKPSLRVVPVMVASNDDNSISLLTTTIKSSVSSAQSSIASTIIGDWDNHKMTTQAVPLTPPQESTQLQTPSELLTPIELCGRRDDTDPVLTETIAEQIRLKLPRRLRLMLSWNLLYSLDQDGTSMTTMYHKVKDKGPLVLVIKDMDEQVFGAFVTEPFKIRPSYYGTGEWDDSSQSTVKCYLWTGRNEYMILSEHDCLAIGGGDGKVGLWIDADLQQGHSERCDTFDNDILSSSPEFDCIGFEVWGFKN
ncbi:20751_t:CDS:2 [Dentiscutata erythropus]|uniref:Oxidation resistance protein 1 n=1 Tax=Dentiscutata erythropus TaxID=1348616 RepID=A0A9N9NHA7_9GLOM|nr:20751_t:CDS:2 [Dentiscutata erythropus]